jgi:hypothetical protein
VILVTDCHGPRGSWSGLSYRDSCFPVRENFPAGNNLNLIHFNDISAGRGGHKNAYYSYPSDLVRSEEFNILVS